MTAMNSTGCRELARWLVLAISGATCLLFLSAPVLAANQNGISATLIYMLFAPICHQIRERSFFLLDHPWAVCQRCSGIYLGILAASLFQTAIPISLVQDEKRRYWVLVATAPLLVDVVLASSGLWSSTPLIRFFTGFLFGSMIASLLIPAITEFLLECPWRQARQQISGVEGGRL